MRSLQIGDAPMTETRTCDGLEKTRYCGLDEQRISRIHDLTPVLMWLGHQKTRDSLLTNLFW